MGYRCIILCLIGHGKFRRQVIYRPKIAIGTESAFADNNGIGWLNTYGSVRGYSNSSVNALELMISNCDTLIVSSSIQNEGKQNYLTKTFCTGGVCITIMLIFIDLIQEKTRKPMTSFPLLIKMNSFNINDITWVLFIRGRQWTKRTKCRQFPTHTGELWITISGKNEAWNCALNL